MCLLDDISLVSRGQTAFSLTRRLSIRDDKRLLRKRVCSGLLGGVVLDTSVLSGGVDLLTSHLSARLGLLLGAVIMAFQCSLCLLPPNCLSNQKKLKELHGKSSSVEFAVLNALLSRQNGNAIMLFSSIPAWALKVVVPSLLTWQLRRFLTPYSHIYERGA